MGRREEFLFEHYRQNLNALIKADSRLKLKLDRDDIVICPLCFNKYFTREGIGTGDLTAEHAPPDKLGGKVGTLTCRDCNNNHGASLDSHLVQYIRDIDALSGTGPTYVDGTASGGESGEFRIEFRSVGDKKWELLGVPKASDIRNIDKFTEEFLSANFKFNLKLRLRDPHRAKVSLIRSAYLIAFSYLGYGFLVNLNLGRLRHLFNNPCEEAFPIHGVLLPFEHEHSDDVLGINLISNPTEMKCYFIVFDVQAEDGLSRRVGVMLPGPNYKDYKMFDNIEDFDRTTVTINHFDIEFADKLHEPFLAHRRIWNSI